MKKPTVKQLIGKLATANLHVDTTATRLAEAQLELGIASDECKRLEASFYNLVKTRRDVHEAVVKCALIQYAYTRKSPHPAITINRDREVTIDYSKLVDERPDLPARDHELPICHKCGASTYYTVKPLHPYAAFGPDRRLLNPHDGFQCTECDTDIPEVRTDK